jgi:hypothetical protein
MRMNRRSSAFAALGVMLAAGLAGQAQSQQAADPQSQQSADSQSSEIAALKAEIDDLKRMLPSQSHTMADVEYHFTNLWFAGRSENWDLATFYLNETRSHLNWTVRLHPVRRVSTGDLDLRPILENVEKTGLADLKKTIDGHDEKAFEGAYRQMLDQCYACHQASEKPYLRPQIPEAPESQLMIHAQH